MKRIIRFALMLFLFSLYSFQTKVEEYSLKAMFIYNFTKFFEWKNFADSTFTIAVLGPSEIIPPLNAVVKGKMVNEKKIIVKQLSNIEELDHCDILFVSRKTHYPLEKILKVTSGKDILVITEKNGYASLGSAINFVIINDNLKFEVNKDVLDKEGIQASSQLMKLAIIVD